MPQDGGIVIILNLRLMVMIVLTLCLSALMQGDGG